MLPKSVKSFVRLHLSQILPGLAVASLILLTVSHWARPLHSWLEKWDVYTMMIVILAATIFNELVDLSDSLRPFLQRANDVLNLESNRAQIFSSQREAASELDNFLKKKKEVSKADLLEYSTGTIFDLLDELKEKKCNIRLLMKNPDFESFDHQRLKIEQRLRGLMETTFKDYPSIEIRCYSTAGSLRGRSIDGEYITLGWYTYSGDKNELYGHSNCMVSASLQSQDGTYLGAMFNRAFEMLWTHPKTAPASSVLESIKKRSGEPRK